MIIRPKKIIHHPLFVGSMVMVVGSNIINFMNYLYHFLMGRLLNDPGSYGVLASLISLLGIFGLLPSFLNLVIVKFTAEARNEDEVKSLVYFLNKRLFIIGVAFFVLIAFISRYLSAYLNINDSLLIVVIGASFLFYLQSFFYRAVLQGLLRFHQSVISQLSENITKLMLGILLVYLGFSVFGATLGILVSAFIGWMVSRKYISRYLTPVKYQSPNLSKILIFSIPVFAQSIASVSMYSTDLILVKHFFSAYETGLYASLSILGRIIFFASLPISSVMFPLISKRKSKGLFYVNIFIYSLLLTLGFSSVILFIYAFFPKLMILVLYGSKYIDGSYLLLKFGIFVTLFTVANLFVTFFLSIGKTKYVYLQLGAAILQVIGISFFHSSLESVIMVSITISLALILCLAVLFFSSNLKLFKK